MAIIEVENLQKSFWIPSERRRTVRESFFGLLRPASYFELRVLDRVSFSVERGETVGVMGRNGSGKSTLLRLVAGIYQPDGGAVRVSAPITPLLELGVGWNPALDAIDNVYLVGAIMGMKLGEIRRSLDEILAFAEIERFANLELQHFSSGMASRLAYAVAFQAVRDVLIIDEIFAVGDAGFRKKCENRYRSLHEKGHTVIVVSHEPRTIASFTDRAFLLDGGRIVTEGDPAMVADEYLRILSGEPGEKTP